MADETPDPRIEAIARALHDVPDPDETTWPAAVQALDEIDTELRAARAATGEREVAIWIEGYRAACRSLEATLRAHAALTRNPKGSILTAMSANVGAAAAEGAANLCDGYANTCGVAGNAPWPVLVSEARASLEALGDRDYDRWLAETARECGACPCFGSPCGGCSAGGVCDGVCQSCERGDEAGDLEDQLDRAMGWDDEEDEGDDDRA